MYLIFRPSMIFWPFQCCHIGLEILVQQYFCSHNATLCEPTFSPNCFDVVLGPSFLLIGLGIFIWLKMLLLPAAMYVTTNCRDCCLDTYPIVFFRKYPVAKNDRHDCLVPKKALVTSSSKTQAAYIYLWQAYTIKKTKTTQNDDLCCACTICL